MYYEISGVNHFNKRTGTRDILICQNTVRVLLCVYNKRLDKTKQFFKKLRLQQTVFFLNTFSDMTTYVRSNSSYTKNILNVSRTQRPTYVKRVSHDSAESRGLQFPPTRKLIGWVYINILSSITLTCLRQVRLNGS